MRNPWKKLGTKYVYANPWMRLREDQVRRPDGKLGKYGFVVIPKTIGVVAIDDRGRVALIQEFRYPLQRWTLEIPRGFSEPGETMLQAAKREAREEAGATGGKWQTLGYVNTSPGLVAEFSYIYLARGVVWGSTNPDAEEKLVIHKVPFAEVCRWARSGKINDAMTLAALFRTEKIIGEQQ